MGTASRRALCVLVLAAIAAATLFAGGSKEGSGATGAEASTTQMEFTGTYNEAPQLKTLVSEGTLPPVDERLPANPLVYTAETIGKYGGTLRIGHVEMNRSVDAMAVLTGYGERLMEISPEDYITPTPGLAQSWEFNSDNTVLTFHLREGLHWSDGEPFTTEDVRFWWEDLQLNEEFTPSVSTSYRPGGETMRVEIVDDYTFRMHFAAPYLTAVHVFCQQHGTVPYRPAHYLKQFHPKYTSMDTLEKLMEEEDDEDWMSLFNRMDRGWPGLANNLNPDRPVTVSHRFVEASGNLNVFERNPYYWKVDQAGNQLPYIDRVEDTYMNREVLTMKIISGELDFVGDPAVFADYTLYKENEDQGNYRVLRWQLAWATDISFMPNQTHIDPVLAEINADRRFRMALSHSVNREKISEIVYNGLATPSQHTVQTPGHLYDEDYVNAYIDYDIQKANDLLDEMGLEWDSQRKYRLRPDGETLTYTIPVVAELGAKMSGIAEIQKQEWERIGLNIELKEMTLDLFSQRIQNQEVDMGLWLGYPGVEISFYTYPRDYVPIQTVWSQWGSEWGRWYSTSGEAGIEPPDHIKQLYDWYEAMKTATDEEERTEYARMILDSQAENLWCVGTVARTPQPLVINEDLTNVPESMIWTWETTYAKIGNPPIWYFDR